jgi:hypothetical protein
VDSKTLQVVTAIKNELLSTIINMHTEIKKWRWQWIGYVYSFPRTNSPILPAAGRDRKRGRPKETWTWLVEREMKMADLAWDAVRKLVSDRRGWEVVWSLIGQPSTSMPSSQCWFGVGGISHQNATNLLQTAMLQIPFQSGIKLYIEV